MVLLALCGQGDGRALVALLQLEDFSTLDALEAWEFRQVERELLAGDKGAARLRFPRWRLWRSKWPAAFLEYGRSGFSTQDWSRYDRLLFEVYNQNSQPAMLRLRLKDANGLHARRLFNIPPQQSHTCRVEIAPLAAEIDIAQVAEFAPFMRQPPQDYTLDLSNIRLEAHELDLQEAELYLDPFHGGQIEVRAQLGRRALCRIEVLNEWGGIAGRHAEETERLRWSWEGGELPLGFYEVVLQVTDTVWNAEPLERRLGHFEVIPLELRPRIAAWQEPTTLKVLLHGRPRVDQKVFGWQEITGTPSGSLQVDMARNEYAAVQVVFLTRIDPVGFSFALEDMRHEETGAFFPAPGSAVYQVGYVHTEKPKEYPVDFVGWWPDPLLPAVQMRAEPGACMPIWVVLRSTPDTQPGRYRGRLGIWMEGKRAGALPLEVRVYGATLPDTTTVRTAFSIYDHALERLYGGAVPPALYRRYQEFVADHRINVDHLYRRTPPDLEMVTSLAQRGRLNAFNLMFMKPQEVEDQEDLERVAGVLDPYVAELRRQGLVERAYIYGFDESYVDEFDHLKRVFGFLKQRYPDVKTMTTAQDPGYGLESGLDEVVDIWVPEIPAFDAATAATARLRGREVWCYIALTAHPFVNWYTEYPALETRLLWWMMYQQQVPGFLYYTMIRAPVQNELMRVDGNNKTNWNPASFKTANGAGDLFYAGPEGPITTMRLENLRDGIEDYELLHLLARGRRDGGARSRALCAELIRSLTDFTRDEAHFARVRRRLLEEVEQVSQDVSGPGSAR